MIHIKHCKYCNKRKLAFEAAFCTKDDPYCKDIQCRTKHVQIMLCTTVIDVCQKTRVTINKMMP